MESIQVLIDNWSLIVVAICLIIVTVQKIIRFIALPTAAKEKEVKEILLNLVLQAEKELGSKTGQFKLSKVYGEFCLRYPELKKWYPLEKFEKLVDTVLWEMKLSFNNEITKKNALKQED